jgi:hypothetical protein
MAITNFIPSVWSETLYKELDKQYIAVANCNRDFEGDIKNCGSVVKLCGIGKINVEEYTKNIDMSNPQELSDTVRELTIDRARYFNFQIDDIDRAQSTPKILEQAMSAAASALSDEADSYVYSLYSDAGNTVKVDGTTEENVLQAIIEAKQKLYENNVNDSAGIVVEVSPAIATLILKAKLLTASDNSVALETGYIGSICGCKVFVSNNIKVVEKDDYFYHKCIVRTKRAISFAEQLSEIEAFRPEKRFADAVKGLHLYGAKVVYPKEMVLLDAGI